MTEDVEIADATPPVMPTGRGMPRRVLRHGLQLLGVSSLAVAQPLLDIYGQNPEAFVANDLSSGQIVGFALLVVLVPPAMALVVETMAYAVDERAGAVVHGVALGAFAALFASGLLVQLGLSGTALVFGLSAAFGVGLAVAAHRMVPVATALRYLALAPVAFVLMFLFGSDASRLVTESATAATGETSWTTSDRPPVVFLVLDEFPLSTIIDDQGEVNAERFPNFARLATRADWFRNATSDAFLTEHSVPSLLSGTNPSGGLPTVRDHPNNLFTLLGPEYDVWEYQVFTDLCPSDLCGEGTVARRAGLRQTLRDSAPVYGHLVLPEGLRGGLPRIDQSWNDFLAESAGGQEADDPEETAATAGEVDQGSGSVTPDADDKWASRGPEGRAASAQAAVIDELVDDLDADAEGRLWFAHVALPHAPWRITPLGNENSTGLPDVEDDSTDEQLEWHGRRSRQVHLLQAGATDDLLGKLIDRMEGLRIWESALVVVTSDHGLSLLPPDLGRQPTENNASAVFRMPMFVKRPGQTTGEVRDENVSARDLIPSIADVLGIDADWGFDGHSLYDGSPYPDDKLVMASAGTPKQVNPSFDDYLETVVAVHERDFPRDDWLGVAAVGEHWELVGAEVDELDVGGDDGVTAEIDQAGELGNLDLAAGRVPVVVTGTVRLADGRPRPDELLVVLNGRVAGVAGGLAEADDGWTFTAVLAEELFVDGENRVEVLVPAGDGSLLRASAGL